MLALSPGPTLETAGFRCSRLVATTKRAASVVALLQAAGSKPRLAVLLELYDGELSVHELLLRTSLGASSMSQHLGMLRRQGLVQSRREGSSVYYAISSAQVRPLLDFLARTFGLARTQSHRSPASSKEN